MSCASARAALATALTAAGAAFGARLTVHLVLSHHRPAATTGSRLVVHRAGREPDRLAVAPGTGVVLAARGTVHGWDRLADGERRTMIAIGFRPAIPLT